tara:strand:+ start:563 stop:856 length:294 start_codon:yes stop_codon:yes gene_type:complete
MSGRDFTFWADTIQTFGFPVIALLLTGYFIWYIWKWVIKEVRPALGSASGSLGKLKKQIQALDNDMIRLNMKLKILIQERHITDKHKTCLNDELSEK